MPRATERGWWEGGDLPQGLGGLIIEDFHILIAGNVLKWILNQSKGCDRKIFFLLCSQGALFCSFVPGPQKALGGPSYTFFYLTWFSSWMKRSLYRIMLLPTINT